MENIPRAEEKMKSVASEQIVLSGACRMATVLSFAFVPACRISERALHFSDGRVNSLI